MKTTTSIWQTTKTTVKYACSVWLILCMITILQEANINRKIESLSIRADTYRQLRIAQDTIASYMKELKEIHHEEAPFVTPGANLVYYNGHILKVEITLQAPSMNVDGGLRYQWNTAVSVFRTPQQLEKQPL